MNPRGLSVVIPTLNEESNVPALVRRIVKTFESADFPFEMIFIDDHSTDRTFEKLKSLADTYPIRCFKKRGKRGKAFSLLEGFKKVRYGYVAILDADLQYPPESLREMMAKLDFGEADIVVANRREKETALWRRVLSRGFRLVFGRFLHDLNCDVQSGCKVFRHKILHEVILDPTPWTFDLEFLLSARNYGYTIGTVDIPFLERVHGQSKIHFFKAVSEIGWNALKLRFRGRPPLLISPEANRGMIGAGVAHKKMRFVTHSTLHPSFSALHTFSPWQGWFLSGMACALLIGFLWNPLITGITITAFLSGIYFIDVWFNLWLILKSLKTPPEIEITKRELTALADDHLPVYSILCPMYREAHILPSFVKAIDALRWPKEKLDVMLLLEENDQETIDAALDLKLPSHFRIVVVPHSFPKTKPKACNYGLSQARGEYIVIYDAEDIPDPWQLRKAYLGFRKAGREVKCLQAKLNYFNPDDNLLTRFFTAEYSLWFDIMLVGLQSVSTTIPLGGTSNHFRTQDLLELEGWDPFNVTEDCDLGVRIFKRGFMTAIIDSVTLEEANSQVKNWLRQRSRWIKGYMQTYLVHMRNPLAFVKENGWHALIFQLTVGGKMVFLFINPILWIVTISYFSFRESIGPSIEALYPSIVFYLAAFALVFGNFLFIYYYMIGCAKRKHWHLIKYVFLVPLYWVLTSIAGYIALYQLLVKPHYWEKTQHGLHLLRRKKRWIDSLSPVKSLFQRGTWVRARAFALPDAQVLSDVIEKEKKSVWLSGQARSIKDFIVSPEGIFLIAIFISNVINFLFNAYLGRMITLESFGLVALVNTFWYFAMIFFGAYSTTVNRETAFSTASGGRRDGAWLKGVIRKGFNNVLLVVLVWSLVAPWLASYFKESIFVFYFFIPALIFGILASSVRGFIQGKMRFYVASIIVLFEPLSRLFLAVCTVMLGYGDFAYLAIPGSAVLTALFAFLFVKGDLKIGADTKVPKVKFARHFYTVALVGSLGTLFFLNADILLVQHYLDPVTAGRYALLALVGKMIFFLGILPASLLVTLVSHSEGRNRNPRVTFYKIYGLTFVFVIGSVATLTFFGDIIVPFLLGERTRTILAYLPVYALAIGFFTLINVIATYHLARKHYLYSFVPLLCAFSMSFLIILHHISLFDVSFDILLASSVWWIVIQTMDIFESKVVFIQRGIRDFIDVFRNNLPAVDTHDLGHSRILIFNWRDRRHKFAGGAEEYVHEIAKGWVAQGHQVTLFCGNDGKSPRHETVDGIHVVRRGGFYLVYLWAFVYYIMRFRGQYDVIVDCQNGIPFFTPLYVRKPVYCLMHHVHQTVFFRDLIKPLAYVASFLEKDLMPLVYKNIRFITVSESSRSEMLELGLGQSGIDVVHPGVHLNQLGITVCEKSQHPTVLYLGRLKAYKSVDVLLKAFVKVADRIPEARLIIAGSGEEQENLRRLAHDLNFKKDQVVFSGHVGDTDKVRLLRSSWVLVNPSYMEGWGLVTIEANACGTPVIASDVPGLRDSVKHDQSGLLVPYGDVDAFASRIIQVLEDEALRESLGKEAIKWASGFDWNQSGESFFSIISSSNQL